MALSHVDHQPAFTLPMIGSQQALALRCFVMVHSHYVGKGSEYRREVGQGSIVLDDVRKPPGVSSVNDTAAFHKYCANASAPAPLAAVLAEKLLPRRLAGSLQTGVSVIAESPASQHL